MYASFNYKRAQAPFTLAVCNLPSLMAPPCPCVASDLKKLQILPSPRKHKKPAPSQEGRIDPVLPYLTVEHSSEWNGDGRILDTGRGHRKFTLNRSGVLAPFESHPIGGPYHHPHMRLVLVETWEIFFWSFWRRGRVFSGDFIVAYPNANLASNQTKK